jgi:isopentenyl diphosphate isomerase/L-lactate dehydrogenase-like FMN-dependent dehydrogenase
MTLRRALSPHPDQTLLVFTSKTDLQKHAQPLLPISAWNYYSFGADGEATMRNNSEVYNRVWFRPRVMRDVTECDISTIVLGMKSDLPIYISPTARNGLGQPLVRYSPQLRRREADN